MAAVQPRRQRRRARRRRAARRATASGALRALTDAIAQNAGVAELDLRANGLSEAAAREFLLPLRLENGGPARPPLKVLLVDTTLPFELFEQLNQPPAAAAASGKKGKKGKK